MLIRFLRAGLPLLAIAISQPAFATPDPADWPGLGRYQAANAAITQQDPERVVFMGDSITEFWDKPRASFFANPHFVNRGISGQTTPQMLLRFRQDVIALHPRIVVILAGTNDIAGNTGPATDAQIEDNIASMVDLARANRITPVLVSLLPTVRYPWTPDIVPAPRIARINAWLADYALAHHLRFADVHAAMATPDGALRPGFGDDGVHPNASGYAAMEAVISPVLAQADKAW